MRAYYNDLDPFCCAVLRKQIAAGNLPEGDVDERDIREVRAEQLMGYGAVHLFAGIGGFPLGFAWAGVPSHWRILTGGFPCTDISNAGKRAGIGGEQSGLWKEMVRLVCECADCDRGFDFVVIENVAALAGRGLSTVLIDLAKAGYDAMWQCLRASDFGAPHIRERLFVVAYPSRQQDRGIFQSRIPTDADASRPTLAHAASRQLHGRGAAWRGRAGLANGGEVMADTNRDRQRLRACQQERQSECGTAPNAGDDGAQGHVAHTQQRQCEGRTQLQAGWEQVPGGRNLRAESGRCSHVADASSSGQPQQHAPALASQPCHTARRTRAPGSVEYATSAGQQSGTQPAGLRAELDPPGSGNAQSGLGWRADGLPDWLDGYRWPAGPGQEQYEWEPPRVTSERVANRIAQLRAYGNSISPPVAAAVGLWLLQIAAWLESEVP